MGSCFSEPKRPKSKSKSREIDQTPFRRTDANKKEPRRPNSVYQVETQTSSRRVVVEKEKNVCEAKNMPPPFLDNRSKNSINIVHKRNKLLASTKALGKNYVEKMSDNDEKNEKNTSSLEEAATMEQEVAESSQEKENELISFLEEQEKKTIDDDEESDEETKNGTKRKPEFEEIDKFEASPDRQSDYENDEDESDYIAYRRTKRSAAIKSLGKNAALAEKYPHLRNERQDTIYYRLDPEQTSDNDIDLNDNVRFFRMEIPSKPSGDFLKNIWHNWWNDYNKLELHHGYIQWLFPLREQGLNSQSQPLQLHELEELTKEPREFEKTKKSLIKSFRMMLGFYGMELNAQTGEIERASNYKQRYANLRNHRHNFLRITRILKCLGDFNLGEYQINWIRFLADEIFVKKALPELNYSMTDYWVHTIKNDEERTKMIDYLEEIIFDNL